MSGLLPVYTAIGGLVMAVSVPIAGLFSPVESTAPPVAPPAPPRVVVVSSNDKPATTTTTTTAVYVPTATPQPTATPRPQPTVTLPLATGSSKARPMPYVETKLGARVPARIKQYEPLILKHAREYNVDPNFVAAVIMTESSGDPKAVSPKNAVGLMQVLDGPADPDANIEEGTAIIGKWLKYYGSVELAIAAYNAGPGNVAKHGGVPPFPETHKHIARTLANYANYSAGALAQTAAAA